MRILLFGGSFDPPHDGHAAILSRAVRAVRPDRVLILPAYQAPLKGLPRASPGERLALIKAWLPAGCRLELSELRSRRKVYTVETLENIQRLHPKAELHFLVGADSAASFHKWRNPEKLRRLATWWAAPRGGFRLPSFFCPLPGPPIDVSSTDLRSALALGEKPAGLPPKVLALIKRRGLYGGRLLAKLRKALPPERFAHSVAVARLASELARRWGLNPDKARLSGLLHDLGRSVPVPAMPAYARRRLKIPLLEKTAREAPLLLHAHISEDLAFRWGYRDPELLSAVRKHTLGDRRMSRLDRLLYVADAASYDRSYKGVASLRRLAFRDLDQALKACARNKIADARRRGAWLHPATLSLWKKTG